MNRTLPALAARRGAFVLLLAAAIGAHAPADAQGRGRSNAAMGELTGESAGPDATLPADGRVERDVAYGTDPQQRIDVYLPARAGRAPVVVMVHGGAWMFGDKGGRGVAATKAARWLPRGAIVVSVNYRMDRARPDPLAEADVL
jgi:arylformamidase